MLYHRSGFPEVDEIVLCKITTIFPNSVFVELEEYRRQGLVHISEVAPGRIRNLRDFVSVGRQVVCKVLRVDREKGHIDLSLRRVNSHERQEKLDEIKQELKSETLVRNLSKKLQRKEEELYKLITVMVFPHYSHLYLCFRDVAAGEAQLEKLGLEKTIAEELTAAILEKFKPSKIFLQGEIKLETYHSDGVELIKTVLNKVEHLSPNIMVYYLGAGRFKLRIQDTDYKPAEKTLVKVQEILTHFNDKVSKASFEREKGE